MMAISVDDVERRMYTVQVAAVTLLDDLRQLGGLTEEVRVKLCQSVDTAQEIVEVFRTKPQER